MTYVEKTTSQRHQRDIFDFFKDIEQFALFWDPGVGKSKPSLDKTCYLYEKGRIDACVIIAPNGVTQNWINDQIPKHMPDRHRQTMNLVFYRSGKAKQKRAQAARRAIMNHHGGLRVLVISFSAIRTKLGKAFVRRFMLKYRCHVILDESQRIKSPGSAQSETCTTAGKYATWKTALSGTPIAHGPFDVFAQIEFLVPDFWKKRGLHPFTVFKKHFGVYVTREEFKEATGFERSFDQLVGYKNQDELKAYLKLVSHRLTMESAGVVLPPKVYTKRYFQLTAQQQQVYNELYEEYVAFLPETGDFVEAPDTIVRLTRLQQITCGYVACEAEDPIQMIDKKNPRMDLLVDTILNDCVGQNVIWSKFTPDVDMIVERLKAAGRRVVRYDGKVSEDERERNKQAFNRGEADDFVGKASVGGVGLNGLEVMQNMHFYSNSYNWEHRKQAEARGWRQGLRNTLLIWDYIAEGTVDVDVVRNLRRKNQVAADMLGDAEEEWI